MEKPTIKPANPNFGSGPCSKPPGWNVEWLKDALVGRSHRSKEGRARLKQSLQESRELLGLPEDYLIGIIAGSDTGAMECAMWSFLGPKDVDICHWESFGKGWVVDCEKQLKLKVNQHTAPYGQLPDLSKVNFDNDVIFTWNGTTAGVCVPNTEWIPADRKGLTICDATSGIFSMDMRPWTKLDIVTYSWQKVLGGEAAHGVMILSPRAVERLESYTPSWPMPKIFRLKKGDKINGAIFQGDVINTVSLLCVEDYLASLKWGRSVGGVEGMIKRSTANLKAVEEWAKDKDFIEFLCADPKIRSSTSICLVFKDCTTAQLGEIVSLIGKEKAGYDIKGYRDAPDGLRLWGGASVETADLEKLLPWIEWAYKTVVKK